MSQTQISDVSATQSEKLSPRLLKSPSTMASKQPAVFLTRYVWSRNRPVCSLRESTSSSRKLPLSEKQRTGNSIEKKPPQRSSSVSMRPPGSPAWPPSSPRWPRHWEASLVSNPPPAATSKYQRTACSQMWLPLPVSTNISTPATVQSPRRPHSQVLLSSSQTPVVSQTGMLPEGSIEAFSTSTKLSTASHRLPVTSDPLSATRAVPPTFGNTPRNFVRTPRTRNGSSRRGRRSSAAPGQSQQPMRWPPRSVKWPNRWNKFSSLPRFSSESSARSTNSLPVAFETKSTARTQTPKQLMSTQMPTTYPREQGHLAQPHVLPRLPIKTTSTSKDMASSPESSGDSSPLSERTSQWTDSLETSGMSPVGSTQSSLASLHSPVGPVSSSPCIQDLLTLGMQRNKELRKPERKSSVQKCAVGSTSSSVSSPQTPEKSCGALGRSTGQPVKLRKLPGQTPPRPTVSSSAKRLQRKQPEFTMPPADDISSSLESTTQSLSPTSPARSKRFLKSEVKLARSATWPSELILHTKSNRFLPKYSIPKESESETLSSSQRILSKPLRPSISVSALSSLKKSQCRWERKRSDVSLVSPMAASCVSDYRFTQFYGSLTFENSPISPELSKMRERPPSNSPKGSSALERARTSVASPTLHTYSPKFSSATLPPSFNDGNPSVASSKVVRMTTACVPVTQLSIRELKGSGENTAVLLAWPTNSPPASKPPVLTASTTVPGCSWSFQRPSERSQAWPQKQGTATNALPMPAMSSETLMRSRAMSGVEAAVLDTSPIYSGVQIADFPLPSSVSSNLWPNQGTSVNILPRHSPAHLISSVKQLSLTPEEPPIPQVTERNTPRMLRKSSPVPPSSPSGMLSLTESSSVTLLKRNTRAMMAPTLSTKFQSRSAFFESSSDVHLAHSSLPPSWPSVPVTPDTPSMISTGLSGRHPLEGTSCLTKHNVCASHLAICCAQTGSYTSSRNSTCFMPSTLSQPQKMPSQPIPSEYADMSQKSLASCSRQSSPSFRPSSFSSSTTNVTAHKTASFPSVYSSSPSASYHITQTKSSAVWISGNSGKSVTSQAPMDLTSSSRHMLLASSAGIIRSVPPASLSTKMVDESEIVPAVSPAAAQLARSNTWTPLVEMPLSPLHRMSLPPHSEINMSWPLGSGSKQQATSAKPHSQLGSHGPDSFTIPSGISVCPSRQLSAPSWSMEPSAFPSITSAETEAKLPTFDWLSSNPFWMSAQSASSLCTSGVTSAPTLGVMHSSPTWANSASQSSGVTPSSKGPVMSAAIHTPIPQPEPSVSWSQSRPAAWSSASSASTTGVSGFQRGPSSGLVRLPIKYVKRQPLPRTGNVEFTTASTS